VTIKNKLNLERALRDFDEMLSDGTAESSIELVRGNDGRIHGAKRGAAVYRVVRDERGLAVAIEPVH
jgi:hypothetical protein